MNRILRIGRILVASLMLIAMTVLFAVPAAGVVHLLGGLASVQWLPSAISFTLSVTVGWLIVTLLLGRIYCSTLCPLGALQDVVGRVRTLYWRLRGKPTRAHYHYSTPKTVIRNAIVIVTFGSLLLGYTVVATLLDPYSAFGRICLSIFGGSRGVMLTWVVAAVTMIALVLMSWKHGRLWCNTLCPVGTALGYVSRHSVMRIDIDTDRCVQCRRCEHVCKSECIDMVSHVVDGSRCVVCFNCIDACGHDAIRYTYTRKQLSIPMMQRVGEDAKPAATMDRRTFLLIGAATTATAVAAKTGIKTNETPRRPLPPPGIESVKDFMSRCTGCGLCVAQCQGKVLRPSTGEYGLLHFLTPTLDYNNGYCLPTCNSCTQCCPTGAIKRLTLAEKDAYKIGLSKVNADACIGCGRCSRACPQTAITMVERKDEGVSRDFHDWRQRLAVVNAELCNGCGACQSVCPVRPVKAIIVSPIR